MLHIITPKPDRAACTTTAVLQLGKSDQKPSVLGVQEASGPPMLEPGALMIQRVTLTDVHFPGDSSSKDNHEGVADPRMPSHVGRTGPANTLQPCIAYPHMPSHLGPRLTP